MELLLAIVVFVVLILVPVMAFGRAVEHTVERVLNGDEAPEADSDAPPEPPVKPERPPRKPRRRPRKPPADKG